MDYKSLHIALSDHAEFVWNATNTTVSVHFLGPDDAAAVVTMPRQALSQLGADIAAELARKPLSSPDR
jgi:hypothetical protein